MDWSGDDRNAIHHREVQGLGGAAALVHRRLEGFTNKRIALYTSPMLYTDGDMSAHKLPMVSSAMCS